MNMKVLPPMGSLPPCREKYSAAIALYVVPITTTSGRRWKLEKERVYVLDGNWMVRRGRALVPLVEQPEQPAALALRDGVEGEGRWWPDVSEWMRDHGLDPMQFRPECGWR